MAEETPKKTEVSEEGLSRFALAQHKAAPYVAASTTLAVAVGGFAYAGIWLDRKLGTEKPWFLIAGTVIGMVGGFISFFKKVMQAGRTK